MPVDRIWQGLRNSKKDNTSHKRGIRLCKVNRISQQLSGIVRKQEMKGAGTERFPRLSKFVQKNYRKSR